MFDWFWNFLYMLSKTIFRIIDGLILCANKLCGIDKIGFDGEEMDFLSYLLFSDEIGFAFRVSAILATILLVIFTVFMIIRNIAKDKAEGTSAQIAIKSFKTILMFFLIPAIMIAFMTLGNIFVSALYAATLRSASTPGAFLFAAFAQDGGMSAEYIEMFKTGEWDYNDTNLVATYMELSEFPFFFSWLAGGVALFGIGSAMLVFVDRILSIVILYIAAPISLSTSVLDDGARFKLWRDQFLAKFVMGYGMILAVNIYALVCGLVTKEGFHFFTGTDSGTYFLDLIMKLLIIAGGALTMNKAMALVGNLVSSGAGSNELRDSLSAGGLAKMVGGAAATVAKAGLKVGGSALSLPFMPLKDTVKDAYSLWTRGKAESWLNGKDKKGNDKNGEGSSGAANNEKAEYGSKDNAKNAINNDGFKTSFDTGNTNNNQPDKKTNAVNDAIQNGGGKNGGQNQDNQNNQNNQNDKQPEGGNNK